MLYWRNIAGNTIAETDSAGSTSNSSYREYVFFAGRRVARADWGSSSFTVYYYFVDHLGSTRVMTGATGSACFKADYLPYGAENTPSGFTNTCGLTTQGPTYKFTGYERDAETGLDYAFARYYNSRLGRFMSADPLAGDTGDPQSLNRYAYVGNNPINRIDPTGLWGECFADGSFYLEFCEPGGGADPNALGNERGDPNRRDDCPTGTIYYDYVGCKSGCEMGHARGCNNARATPQQAPQGATKPSQQLLEACISQTFGSAAAVTHYTAATPGGYGRITVGIRGRSISVVTNARTHSGANIAAALASDGREIDPGLNYTGYTDARNPWNNFAANNQSALGVIQTQIHEFGHSLQTILTGRPDGEGRSTRGHGQPLENCVAANGGFGWSHQGR